MASIPSFIFGAGTKYKTQEELDRAREQVKALLGDIGQSKYEGWGSVLADLGKGISARVEKGRIGEGQEFLTGEQSKLWDMFGGGGGGVGDISTEGGSDALAGGVGNDDYRSGIAGLESSGNYRAIGPRHPKMGRALGKYQIMESNIGPWSREALGREVSPEEFLADEGIQDAIFDAKFGSYVKQYGPEGAARAWLGGPGGVNKPGRKDVLGTSVGDYGRRFMNSLGGGGSNAQAGGGAGDSFLQAQPNPARFAPEIQTPPPAAPSPLDDRRRMTPAMMGGVRVDDGGGAGGASPPSPIAAALFNPKPMGRYPLPLVPGMDGPMPQPVGPGLPMPPQPMPAPPRQPTPPVPSPLFNPQAMGAPQSMRPPVGPDPTGPRLGTAPPTTAGHGLPPGARPGAIARGQDGKTYQYAQVGGGIGDPNAPQDWIPVNTGQSMAGTETAPQQQFAPTPAQPPIPVARQQVDPFTDMILGDKAAQFKPGNVTQSTPAENARGLLAAQQLKPFGANVFPAAPPAPGTPAAAGFGVPQQAQAGGGGANRQVGGGGGQFPPAPAAPGQRGGGGPQDKIGKLMTILASPYASDEQKRMATAMLTREYALEDERRKANTPEALLGQELTRAQIDKLKRDTAEEPGGEETFFGNPILINKPGGKTAYGIYGNKGTFKEIQLPEGTTVAPPTEVITTKTEEILVDQAGNVISRTPIQNREAAAATAAGTEEGKTEATVASELDSITSKMPGVRETVDELGKLADAATYTQAGQLWDTIREQTGAEPREASVARSKYNVMVSNQILPLLKETFGTQFTDAEGLRLQATLGDADVAPSKKHAALEAFLRQKENDIAALQRRAEKQPAAPAGGGSTGQVFDYVPGKGMVLRQ